MPKLLQFSALLLIFVIIISVGLGFYGFTQFQPMSDTPAPKVNFVVSKGEGASQLASQLQTANLIKSSLAFRILVWKNQLANRIQAGTYQLAPSMTIQQIGLELTTTPSDVRVTIKEGLRREELADFLANQELPAFDKPEFLTLTKDKEGTLFPDTYQFSRQATAQTIANKLTGTFEAKVTTGLADQIAASGHSLAEITTMASIIQREARGPQITSTAGNPDPVEMKMIAGILWKRVEVGIPLGIDATLQYLAGYNSAQQTWWPTTGLVALKESTSHYNTYKYAGLPPGPICNPGIYALAAATQPTASPYYFYLHDSQGRVHYAKTLEEQTKNIQTYLR